MNKISIKKWPKKNPALKYLFFSISGWDERLSNHRSCIKRMRRELAEDCIKCLKHRVDPVTFSAADSTVFFFFCYNTNIYKMWKPRKKIQRNYHPGHTKFLLKFLICESSIITAAAVMLAERFLVKYPEDFIQVG